MTEKYTLFTNLDWVTIGAVRTFTHALLLCDSNSFGERRRQVRGFGTDPAWPTFDLSVKSIDYTMEDAQGNLFKMQDNGSLEALVSGVILKLKDGPELEFAVQNRERPLDIQHFEGEEHTITEVWEVLKKKVPQYWDAPNMPTLTWRRAEDVRRYGVH